MANLGKVDAFFSKSQPIQVMAPAAGRKQVDYARQYAESHNKDLIKRFFANPEKIRVVAPSAAAGRVNHAARYAETIGAKVSRTLENAQAGARFSRAIESTKAGAALTGTVQKAAGVAEATAKTAINPYLAGRNRAAARAPTQKIEAINTLTKRKGRSL